MRVKLEDVCKRIYAGGDVPKDRYSEVKTDEYSVPIYANAEKDEGLYGYTDKARENELSITVAARGTIGFTSIRREPFLPVVRLITVVPDTKKVSERYLYYVLKNCKSYSTGTSIPQLTVPDIKKKSFELCNIHEQEEIADRLDKVNEIIQLRKKELQLLEELIKARFVEMFGDVKYESERWGGKPFKDITINLDSKRKPVKDADRKSMQGIYPYYGATGIVDYINDYRQDGDFLLISEDGKALELRSKPIAFLASGKIWVNNHAHVQQCTDECNMIYLMYHINFMDISIWVTGIDQKKLNRANLDTIPIALPPIELQEQFAAFVHQVDKSKLLSLIKLLEQLITYLYNVFIIYRQDKGEEVERHE